MLSKYLMAAAPALALVAVASPVEVQAATSIAYSSSAPDWTVQSQDQSRYRSQRYRSGRNYNNNRYDQRRYDQRYYNDNRYYDDRYQRCDNGTGGAIIGGVAGGLAGHEIAKRGDKTVGTIIGGVIGAVAGHVIDKSNDPCRRR